MINKLYQRQRTILLLETTAFLYPSVPFEMLHDEETHELKKSIPYHRHPTHQLLFSLSLVGPLLVLWNI